MKCRNIGVCERACGKLGYCVRTCFLALSEDELKHVEIIRAVRRTAFRCAEGRGIKPGGCREWMTNEYRDARVQIINACHQVIELDMRHFEPSDAEIDNDCAQQFEERLREFFRSNVRLPEYGSQRLFVTQKWRGHFIAFGTVLGASYPEESQWWPRVINGKYVDPNVANVNGPPAGF